MTRFRSMINVDGLDFFNLSLNDAADMIDAFLEGGNDRYDYAALPEFMLVPNKTSWLEALRNRIIHVDDSRKTGDHPDGLASQNGREDLLILSRELRLKARSQVSL